ncbi:MAG: MarR family transcriptional regulator, partial [Clostridia bacterium]|nr:MarR family transcriptional regulator [Clostridia bacterium]
LKRLEKKGYVTRARSADDERIVIVTVTDCGMALREKLADIPSQVGGCIDLAPEEASELYRLLYKLLKNGK